MSWNKILLIGCAGILVFGCLLLIGISALLVSAVSEPENIQLSVNAPIEVKVGDEFDLLVDIKNDRAKKVFNLDSIDIWGEYLEGFSVISTDPPADVQESMPLDDGVSFIYSRSIPAQAGDTFKIRLRAESLGIFRGDLDIYDGMHSMTHIAQTVVKE